MSFTAILNKGHSQTMNCKNQWDPISYNKSTVARQDCTNYSSARPEDGRKTTETSSHRSLTPWFQVIIA
jgi:hypothetical protein